MSNENLQPEIRNNLEASELLKQLTTPQQDTCQSKESCECERSKDEKNQESDALKDLSEYLKKYQIQDDAISKELKQTLHTIYRLADVNIPNHCQFSLAVCQYSKIVVNSLRLENIYFVKQSFHNIENEKFTRVYFFGAFMTLKAAIQCSNNIRNYWILKNPNSAVNKPQPQQLENLENFIELIEQHRIKKPTEYLLESLKVSRTLKSVESTHNGHKFTLVIEAFLDIFSPEYRYVVRQVWNQDVDKTDLYGLFRTGKEADEFSEKLLGFYKELNATENHEPAVAKIESELDKINEISHWLKQFHISQADMTKALTNCIKVPNVLKSGIFNFDADNEFVLTLEKYASVSCSGNLYAVRQSFNGKDNTVNLFGMFKDDVGTAFECFYSVLEYCSRLHAFESPKAKESTENPDNKKEPKKIVNFIWLAKETEKHKILNANAVKALLTKYTRVFSVSTMTHEFVGLHKRSEHLYKISVELEGTPKTGYNPLVRAEFFSDGVLMNTVFYSDFDDLTAATKFSEHLKQYYVSLLNGSFTDL